MLAAWLQARELAIQRIKKAIESLGMPTASFGLKWRILDWISTKLAASLSEINAPAMVMAVRSMKAHFNASAVVQKGLRGRSVPDRWVGQTSLRLCGCAATSQGYAFNTMPDWPTCSTARPAKRICTPEVDEPRMPGSSVCAKRAICDRVFLRERSPGSGAGEFSLL